MNRRRRQCKCTPARQLKGWRYNAFLLARSFGILLDMKILIIDFFEYSSLQEISTGNTAIEGNGFIRRMVLSSDLMASTLVFV